MKNILVGGMETEELPRKREDRGKEGKTGSTDHEADEKATKEFKWKSLEWAGRAGAPS